MPTQGFGHSTPQMACEVAAAAGARHLALFHHDPNYDNESVHDLEEQAQSLFKGAFAAREGLEFDLATGTTSVLAGRGAVTPPLPRPEGVK
jgi:ribonuclease BN (tRNA processing enzyme)